MLDRRTYAIIVADVVLAAVLDLLIHLIPDSPGVKPWLEHQPWYSPKSLLLAGVCLVVAIIAVELWRHRITDAAEKKTQSSRYALDPALRLQLLDKIKRERVEPRLRQGLREAIRVDLGLTETPNAVQPKLRAYVTSESSALADHPIESRIQDIFKQAARGRLLILGEPGTGKTHLFVGSRATGLMTPWIQVVAKLSVKGDFGQPLAANAAAPSSSEEDAAPRLARTTEPSRQALVPLHYLGALIFSDDALHLQQ